MATFGVTSVSYSSWEFTGLNTLNQEALLAALSELGKITAVTAQMGGHAAAVNTAFCVWDGSGNLLANSGTFSAAKGTGVVGGQTVYTQSLGPLLAAAANYYLGWYRAPANDAEWSYAASGTLYQKTNTGGSPASMSGASTVAHQILGYATYTPVKAFIRRSGAWVAINPTDLRRSGAWSIAADNLRRSGAWTPVAYAYAWHRPSRSWHRVRLEDAGEPRRFGSVMLEAA